jgi:hypothetical protein
MHHEKRVGFWSNVIVAVTVILFGVSIFTHGLTHELLLEVGVFLVSVKLVLGGKKNELGTERLERRLEAIQEQLEMRGEPR